MRWLLIQQSINPGIRFPVLLAGVTLLLGAGPMRAASPAPPVIDRVSPLGLCPGKSMAITLTGNNLDKVAALWTTFPSDATKIDAQSGPGQVSFLVTVPPGVPAAVGALRVIGSNGISRLRLVALDHGPAGTAAGNTNRETAWPLEAPQIIDAAVPRLGFHYYRVAARAGEQIHAEVVAQRIGSKLDPVIRLLNASGRELQYADDSPGIAPDCLLNWRATAGGDYFLEVRDIEYGGGPDYGYRLRFGTFSLPYLAFPLVAQFGTTPGFLLLSDGLGEARGFVASMPPLGQACTLTPIVSRGIDPSPAATICLSPFPQVAEVEPNDEPGQGQMVPVPCGVNGRFEAARDRDYYRFQATKGERLVFAGQTRGLGSPCDLYFQLERIGASGHEAAGLLSETNFTHAFRESGEYALRLEELTGKGGAALPYQVEIQPFLPGFKLAADLEGTNAEPGGVIEIKVAAARFDFSGPIKLMTEGLDPDFLLDNDSIGEGKTETQVKLTVPFRAAPGSVWRFRIAGRAGVEKKDYYTRATTLPFLRQLFPSGISAVRNLDGWVTLGIR